MNDAVSSSSDPGRGRPASTKDRLRGPKPPLRVGHAWSIRARLQLERRVRAGVWNKYATAESMPDQHEVNLLLSRMPDADREILAKLMAAEVELGVFETLKALQQFEIPPFEAGYEGSPFNDFIGRLDAWEWPEL